MNLSLRQRISRFPFERTIDWRVEIEGLELHNLPLLAKSVEFPLSLVEVSEDSEMRGFYQSMLTVPKIKMEVYTDNKGIIEGALRLWNSSAFDEKTGFIPLPIASPDNPAVKRIKIHRIVPISIHELKAGWENEFNISTEQFSKLGEQEFVAQGYLARIGAYAGSSSASIRTIPLEIQVTVLESNVNTYAPRPRQTGSSYSSRRDPPQHRPS